MRLPRLLFRLGVLSIVLGACTEQRLPASGGKAQDQPNTFVTEFYTWYTHAALAADKERAWYTALRERPRDFSPPLLEAMTADTLLQARTPDAIVGLDFDPILGSQDPCPTYHAGRVQEIGSRYRVEMLPGCGDAASGGSSVIAELEKRGSDWVFTNFIYPGIRADLISLLHAAHRPS